MMRDSPEVVWFEAADLRGVACGRWRFELWLNRTNPCCVYPSACPTHVVDTFLVHAGLTALWTHGIFDIDGPASRMVRLQGGGTPPSVPFGATWPPL